MAKSWRLPLRIYGNGCEVLPSGDGDFMLAALVEFRGAVSLPGRPFVVQQEHIKSILVCFTLYSGKGPLTARLGRRICFWIPVNMPGRTIPGPNPLFQIDGKAPSWLPDAIALASVEALIPTAGKEMAAQLRGGGDAAGDPGATAAGGDDSGSCATGQTCDQGLDLLLVFAGMAAASAAMLQLLSGVWPSDRCRTQWPAAWCCSSLISWCRSICRVPG